MINVKPIYDMCPRVKFETFVEGEKKPNALFFQTLNKLLN